MHLIGGALDKSVSVMAPTSKVASSLNADMTVEILMRLPVRSVLRFRCVCKQWRDILSEPRFLQDHFKQSLNHTSIQEKRRLLLFDHGRGHPDDAGRGRLNSPAQAIIFDVSTRTHRCLWKASSSGNHRMIGACNGLLCVRTCRYGSKREEIITLANPVTGETLTVAPLFEAGMGHGIGTATYGFGFHPETRQFKIISCLCSSFFGEFDKMRVYTLGDMSWRKVVIPAASCKINSNVVSIGGAAYWINEDSGQIFSFDLKEEHVTSNKLPPPLNVDHTEPPYYMLTEVNGRLCVAIKSVKSGCISNLDIWCLEDAVGRRYWSHIYCVSFYKVPPWNLNEYYFVHEGYFLLELFRIGTFVHRIKEKRTLHIDDETEGIELEVSDPKFDSQNITTFAYTESFAPLSIYRT